MPYQVLIGLSIAGGIAGGVVIGILAPATPAVLLVVLVVFAALLIVPRLYLRYRYPARFRALLQGMVDAGFSPPADAEPIEHGLPQRLHDATETGGAREVKALLDRDFTLVDPKGKRYDAGRFLAFVKCAKRAYPDLRERIETMVAEPAAPEVLWTRSELTGKPRRGPALEAQVWTRWTLATGGEQVREIAQAGVVRVA